MDLVLNKNFYNYLGSLLFCGNTRVYNNNVVAVTGTSYTMGFGYSSGDFPCSLIDYSGTSKSSIYVGGGSGAENHTFFVFNNNYSSAKSVYFLAGSDSTPATIDDTTLISPNTNITVTLDTGKRDTENSIMYAVTFSASSAQTLGEVGFIRDIPTASNAASTIMLGRCALDEPIVLKEDNNYQATLQIRLALPIPS